MEFKQVGTHHDLRVRGGARDEEHGGAWYEHKRGEGATMYEGAGVHGGDWMVKYKGEQKVFGSKKEAEEHFSIVTSDAKNKINDLEIGKGPHAVVRYGGQIGHAEPAVVGRHEDFASAQEHAKRLNKLLTPGEKNYYKIKYKAHENYDPGSTNDEDVKGIKETTAGNHEWQCPHCKQTFTGNKHDEVEIRAYHHLDTKHKS